MSTSCYDSLEYAWNLKSSVLKVERRQHARSGDWSTPAVLHFLRLEAFAGIRTIYVPFYIDNPNPAGPIVWNEGNGK
jgi:lysozyme family protein